MDEHLANEAQILKAKAQMSSGFLNLGKSLLECKKHEYYKLFGFPTFTQYVESGRIGISRSHAFRCMLIADYVMSKQLPEQDVISIGVGKMEMLPTLAKDKNVQEVVSQIKSQTWDEVVDQYKAIRTENSHKINSDIEIERWQPSWKFPMSFRDLFYRLKQKFCVNNNQEELTDEYFIELVLVDYLSA